MAHRRLVIFLVLIMQWAESSGEESCLSSDLNAVAIRLRTLTTDTHDTIAAMQDQIAQLQNMTQRQNSEIEAIQTKVTELETAASLLDSKITNLTQESQSEIARLREKDLAFEKSLQTLIGKNQQQDALLESLRFRNATEKVAFIARKPNNTDPPHGHILEFETLELNTGNCYDSSTGKFTAPVAGTYLFSVQLCVRYGSGIYYTIKSSKTNDNVHAAVFHGANYRDGECSSVTTVIILSRAESVWVESGYTTGHSNEIYLDVKAWNMFLGTLLVS